MGNLTPNLPLTIAYWVCNIIEDEVYFLSVVAASHTLKSNSLNYFSYSSKCLTSVNVFSFWVPEPESTQYSGKLHSYTRACLNVKTTFPGMGVSNIKIRRSWDRLIFIMGIPILARRHFILRQASDLLTAKDFVSVTTFYWIMCVWVLFFTCYHKCWDYICWVPCYYIVTVANTFCVLDTVVTSFCISGDTKCSLGVGGRVFMMTSSNVEFSLMRYCGIHMGAMPRL